MARDDLQRMWHKPERGVAGAERVEANFAKHERESFYAERRRLRRAVGQDDERSPLVFTSLEKRAPVTGVTTPTPVAVGSETATLRAIIDSCQSCRVRFVRLCPNYTRQDMVKEAADVGDEAHRVSVLGYCLK